MKIIRVIALVLSVMGLTLFWSLCQSVATADPQPASPAADGSAGAASSTSTDQSQMSGNTASGAAAPAAASGSATPAAAPAQPAPKPSPILQQPGLLTLGWADWNLSGNQNKFRQYATPPDNFFVQQLRYVPVTNEGNLGVISLEDIGEPDYRADADFEPFGGRTELEGLVTRSEFYEATPFVVEPSVRQVQDYYAQQQIGHGFKLSTRYRMDQQDQNFAPGYDSLHQRTRYNDVVARGKIAGGFLNVSYSNLRYWDRTQVLYNTQNQHYQASYLRDLGANSVEAKMSTHTITSYGAPSTYTQSMALSDFITFSPLTHASVSLAQDNIGAPIVQDEYVRLQQSATAGFEQTLRPNWQMTVAGQLRKAERVNLSQTDVETPRWDTLEARINGRLGPDWRVLIRASTVNLWGPPTMVVSLGSLLWNNTQNGEIRLEGTAGPTNGYLTYSVMRETNAEQGVIVTDQVINVGGDWQATDALTLSTDLTNETWGANNTSTAFSMLGDELSTFAPSSDTLDFGADWAAAPTWFLNANFSKFITYNDNPLDLQDANTSGNFLTVEVQKRFGSGRQLGVTVSPWAYRDSVVQQMDSTTTVVMVTASTPF